MASDQVYPTSWLSESRQTLVVISKDEETWHVFDRQSDFTWVHTGSVANTGQPPEQAASGEYYVLSPDECPYLSEDFEYGWMVMKRPDSPHKAPSLIAVFLEREEDAQAWAKTFTRFLNTPRRVLNFEAFDPEEHD